MQALYLAALADFTLSGFIFVVWRMRPDDRYAVHWAASFACMAIGVATLGSTMAGAAAGLAGAMLSTMMIATALTLLWSGTCLRIGKPRPLPYLLLFTVLAAGALAVGGFPGTPLGNHIAVFEMCGTFLWCGCFLWREVPAMRVAAAAFILRGVLVGSFLLGRQLGENDSFIILAIFTRAAFALGLVYNMLGEAFARWRESEGLRSAAMESSSLRLNGVIESLSDCLYVRDTHGRIVMANSACARMLGREQVSDVIGRVIGEFVVDVTPETLAHENLRVLHPGAAAWLQLDTEIGRHDGSRLPVEMRLSRFRVDDGEHCILVQMRDLTERKHYEEKLVQQITIDEVTQLPNRRMLMDRLRQALAMGRRGGGACAVMMIDLDHFKRINETRGHTLGDALLARAAQRLRDTLREADTVARFGGDEFVVVLTEADPIAAPLRVEYAAQRVVEAFQHPFLFDEMQVVTTASVGIAVWPVDGDDAETLVRNADTAMYEIKKSTRNGFCLFNRDMNLRVQDVLRIDAQLRGALERQELRVVFQPIVDASSHRMMKVEALLRWRSATLGDVPPDHFIPVAEETGQINAIGAWVLEESCRKLLQLQALRHDGELLVMSVNVSPRQLMDPDFAATVNTILARTGMPAAQLELELTERILIDDNPGVLGTIALLRESGVSFSLDDFGTGYSSLSYLTRFPLNTVKLDRSFVRDIETNPQSLQLATAVIAMCRSLGLALVAEGVESGDQADLLRLRGCRYLQGYHFGRPVSAEEVCMVRGFQCEAITHWG
ncbi:MAG: Diguanylate cyclase [Rhodocyclales bacterium]|nr:Diguanylate cyclase [Rhodocyclales bacterium]